MPIDVSIEETARLKEALRSVPVEYHPMDAPPAAAVDALLDHLAQTQVVALEYSEPAPEAPAEPEAPALDLSSLDTPAPVEGGPVEPEAEPVAAPLGLFAAEQPAEEDFEEVVTQVVTRRKKGS